jgi:hypothetical protein
MQKIPVIYRDGQTFDGFKLRDVTKLDYYKTKRNKKYIVIPTDYRLRKEVNGEMVPLSIQEEHEHFVKNADTLMAETQGLINFYETGTVKNTIWKLYEHFIKIEPEPITWEEVEFIEGASCSALISNEPYTGPAYKYDECCMYASMLSSTELLIPIKKGDIITITQDKFKRSKETFFAMGIYRCIIHKSTNPHMRKMFIIKNTNYYTHIELTRAKELGLQMELIEDGKPNFLHYPRDRVMNGSKVFGDMVDYLFKYKKVSKYVKSMLSMFWGIMCARKVVIHTIDDDDSDFELGDDSIDWDTYPVVGEDKTTYEIIYKNDYYQNNFSRVKPFLLARGRTIIGRIIEPYIEHVKRVATDGFISTIPLDISINDRLHCMKYEGYCDRCVIKNAKIPEGKFVVDWQQYNEMLYKPKSKKNKKIDNSYSFFD